MRIVAFIICWRNSFEKNKKNIFAVFNPKELQILLMEAIETMNVLESRSDRESIDLSPIQYLIIEGGYSDPWEYVDHVWYLFDKACISNEKRSKVSWHSLNFHSSEFYCIDSVIYSEWQL